MSNLTSAVQLLFIAMLGAGITSCVSTEELYAKYDASNCKFIVEKDTGGVLSLRELVSNSYFPWEPAVYFDYNSHALTIDNSARLDKSMLVLLEYPKLKLGLQGFTDSRGSVQYNRLLAERRTNSVREYFMSKGIEGTRIVSQPIGEQPTLGQVDNQAMFARSRRVELMLLDEDGIPLHPLHDFSGN